MTLVPAALIDDSLERHIADHSVRASPLYMMIVLLTMGGIGSLPLIKVDVSVQSNGFIRSSMERHEARARVSGIASVVSVQEGQVVQKGQVIAQISAASADAHDAFIASQSVARRRAIGELERLSRADGIQSAGGLPIQSPDLRQQHSAFLDEMNEARVRLAKSMGDLERTRSLSDRGFATQVDLEEGRFAVARARSGISSIVQRYRTTWQTALAGARLELQSLESQIQQAAEERALYVVTAPVTGAIEELTGISAGSFVQAGDRVAIISPNADLVAEVSVSPRDIGLIRQGTEVRMLIDAFNYNDWGSVSGRVIGISDDYLNGGSAPMFRVRCAMDQDHVALRDGITGRLKKGMTLRARFIVSRRSLLQLLRDDVNDWLNPIQGSELGRSR